MVKITKVYTKQGDAGSTAIAGHVAVAKDGVRIQAIGAIDELNACLGCVINEIKKLACLEDLVVKCLRIQHELFNLGAQLAVLPQHKRANTPAVSHDNIVQLEKEIDLYNSDLPTLLSFVLPGGSAANCQLHFARAVCRRAERWLVTLYHNETDTFMGTELPYINRLSDWLFVVARYCVLIAEEQEVLWKT